MFLHCWALVLTMSQLAFMGKGGCGKAFTSAILLLLTLLTKLCQCCGGRGSYRTGGYSHCPSTSQPDLAPGSQCGDSVMSLREDRYDHFMPALCMFWMKRQQCVSKDASTHHLLKDFSASLLSHSMVGFYKYHKLSTPG